MTRFDLISSTSETIADARLEDSVEDYTCYAAKLGVLKGVGCGEVGHRIDYIRHMLHLRRFESHAQQGD